LFALAVSIVASRAEDKAAEKRLQSVSRSNAIYAPQPEYPEGALRLGRAGSGVLIVNVRDDGTVESVDVFKSTGYADLDHTGVATLRKWRFRPGTIKRAKVPITFSMYMKGAAGKPTYIYLPK
jgi:protein TonB